MTDKARIWTGICISLFAHFMLFHAGVSANATRAGKGERLNTEMGMSRPLFSETVTISLESADESNPSGNGADTRQKERRAFLEAVSDAIHSRRFLSPEARGDFIGLAWFSFTIATDGGFRHVTLATSSGNAALDRAAGEAVRAASGVVKRPPSLGNEEIPLVMAVKYQYNL